MIAADKEGATVTIGGETLRVEGDWTPGDPLAKLMVDGDAACAENRQNLGRVPHPLSWR